jgi:APA family basic amino acid/polyamine antiporter
MLGVLLNLVLGLSRVLLAMGRRGDMPTATANLSVAVVVTGVAIAALAAAGSVKTNWSFSAFTVLVYYAITNAAALRLNADDRLYPRWIAWIGLVACLSLAFAVEWQVWLAGVALLAGGLAWHAIRKNLCKRAQQNAVGGE